MKINDKRKADYAKRRAVALELRGLDWTLQAIADKIGVSWQAVQKMLKVVPAGAE